MRADKGQTDVDRLLGTLGVPELRYKSFLAASIEPAVVTRAEAASTIARSFPLLAAAMPEIAEVVAAAQSEPVRDASVGALAAPEASPTPVKPDVTLQQQPVRSMNPARAPAPIPLPPARPVMPTALTAGATSLRSVFRVLRGEAAVAQPEAHAPSLRGLFQR